MPKTLYRGVFAYKPIARVLYAYANTKRQAWFIFCKRLAKKDGVKLSDVMDLFDGSNNNYQIEEGTE